MKFEKGRDKTGGRQKGTPNKTKVLRIEDVLVARGLNPIEKILEILEGPNDMYDSDKAKLWLALQSYCQPKASNALELEEKVFIPRADISFEEFCEVAGYPTPYPKQLEMREWVFEDEEKEPRLLLGTRGIGKTDYVTLLGTAFEIYRFGDTFSCLLVTKSPERNQAILREVATALEKNGVELCIENAKELRVPELTGKDNSYSAVTIGASSLRGRHPKLAIMDDPVTPEDTRDSARRRVRVVYDELYKICKNIVVIGQPVHKFDLYGDLRPILRKKEFPYGSIPELDPDITAMRTAGITEETIQASYFLNVTSDQKNPFDNLRFVDEYPLGDSVGFIDPSQRGIDYTSLSIGRGYFDGIAIQGFAWKRGWDHCVEQIAEACKTFRVKKLGFETNGLGEQPLVLLRQALRAKGLTIEVVGRDSTGNKHSRILAAGNFAHLIHLSRRSDKVYQDLVTRYEYGVEHDDPPDSLASLLAWMGLIKGKETGR